MMSTRLSLQYADVKHVHSLKIQTESNIRQAESDRRENSDMKGGKWKNSNTMKITWEMYPEYQWKLRSVPWIPVKLRNVPWIPVKTLICIDWWKCICDHSCPIWQPRYHLNILPCPRIKPGLHRWETSILTTTVLIGQPYRSCLDTIEVTWLSPYSSGQWHPFFYLTKRYVMLSVPIGAT